MATLNDVGIPGVGSGILQPMLKNRFRVTFANMGGGTDSQPVSMQVVTADKPKLSFAEVELHRYNSVGWIAGKHTWEPITIVVESDVTGTAAKVINDQMQKQQWLIGAEGQFLAASGEGSLYKFICYIDQLDGNEQVIETWTLEGCWLQNTDWENLDYAASEALKITMSIRFDHARQSIGGYDQGEGVALGGVGRI